MPSCFVIITLGAVISVELLVGFACSPVFHLHTKLQQQIDRGMRVLYGIGEGRYAAGPHGDLLTCTLV